RKAGVAPFAGQRDPPAFAGGNEAGYAQPGARAKKADGSASYGLTAADELELVRRQVRKGEGEDGKIVQQLELVQPERLARGFSRERPLRIRHGDVVARHGIGDSDHGRL